MYVLNGLKIVGMSLLCSNFIYYSFKNFPKKLSHYSFFILIPSLLFLNYANNVIALLEYLQRSIRVYRSFQPFSQLLYDIASYKLFLVVNQIFFLAY